MNQQTTKLIRAGEYVAEVDVELTDAPDGWALYLPAAEEKRLSEATAALQRVDLAAAARQGRVFRLTPVTAGP